MNKLLLGVNIDHVATLRQARGGATPGILEAAEEAIAGGADSITVHLREDRRHIQDEDVTRLKEKLKVPLNLEMSMAEAIVDFAEQQAPAYTCLVPENRQERTTESGLDVAGNITRVTTVCARLGKAGSRVSLFIDPVPEQVTAAAAVGAAAVELHTGDYANASNDKAQQLLQQLRQAALQAHELGLLVHAGHGLDIDNIKPIVAIQHISELNIGYSIVCRAIFCGIRNAAAEIKAAMER